MCMAGFVCTIIVEFSTLLVQIGFVTHPVRQCAFGEVCYRVQHVHADTRCMHY